MLQDKQGRDTYLSLAVIDSPKNENFGNDIHSSKHLILPLVVNKRLTMLNQEPVSADTKKVRVPIHSESGFDAAEDLSLESLRLGRSGSVNFSQGAKFSDSQQHADGLVLIFTGSNQHDR